jgi:uncharacterized protein YkwD
LLRRYPREPTRLAVKKPNPKLLASNFYRTTTMSTTHAHSRNTSTNTTDRIRTAKTLALVLLIFAIGMALQGCGGSAGSSAAASLGPPAPTIWFFQCDNGKSLYSSTISEADAQAKAMADGCPGKATSTLVSNVPTPTYSDPEVLAAFNYLNAKRTECGFGKLAQNAQLDTAASNHASYVVKNNHFGHTEIYGRSSYSGVTPMDRVRASAYPISDEYAVNETISGAYYSNIAGMGVHQMRGLLGAPYHLLAAFHGFRDVGIGFKYDSTTNMQSLNLDYAFNRATLGVQIPTSTDIQTYPCQGSTGFNYRIHGENPSPLSRDLDAFPAGHPIMVQVRFNQVLKITSATVTNLSNGQSASLLHLRDCFNDPNLASWQQCHRGYVLPDQPLMPNTLYQITVNGTNNGVAFSRTFTATTGSKDDQWWNGV